jgi:hypothetical protein
MTVGGAATLLTGDDRIKSKVTIVAPSNDQSDIVMNYIRGDIVKVPLFTRGLIDASKVERIQTEFSKDRIAWVDGREILTLTASAGSNSGDINKGAKSLMGFGGSDVIVDESALIPDPIFGKIFRMLGGDAENSRLIQISNPFNLNHFYKASIDPNYLHICIDYRQAIAEGRLNQRFVDEARNSMSPELFKIFYEVKFVVGSEDGYITNDDYESGLLYQKTERERFDLLTEAEKMAALQNQPRKKMGVDVAYYGGDKSVILIRQGTKILHKQSFEKIRQPAFRGEIVKAAQTFGIEWEDVNIDYIGVGVGLVEELQDEGMEVCGVIVSESPEDAALYLNKRAELWGRMKIGIREGLEVPEGELKTQTLGPKYEYRYQNKGVVRKVESKEDMQRRGIDSPDEADALALTYFDGGSKFYFGTGRSISSR